MDTSKTTKSPAPTSAEPTSVRTEMNTQTTESVIEDTNQVLGPTSESQSALVEVNVNTSEDKNVMEASANPEPIEETTSASPTPPEAPGYSHATPTPAQDATSEDFSEKDNEGDAVASATVTSPSTEMSAESELEGPKPAAAEVEDVEATKKEPGIESLADQEPALSNTEATEPMDLDVVDNSGGEFKNVSSNDHDPNPPAEEVTHAQGGSDHKQVAFKNISPADVPMSSPDSTPRASQSDDTTTKVSRLHATCDTSGESRASEREDEKMEDDTVPGAQAENNPSDNGKVMAAEPVVDSNPTTMTSESTSEQEEEDTILLAKTRGSLFGGPDGKQIPPTTQPPETPQVGSVTQSQTPKGFDHLFPQDMAGISMQSQTLLDQASALNTGPFKFETSNAEKDAGPGVEKDVEPEAVLGAQREVASPPPSPDDDAKPDISAYPSTPSPAYTHKTSSTSSQLSQKTKASEIQDVIDLIGSGGLYAPETHNQQTPEEASRSEQALNDTDQSVVPSVEQMQPCNCEGHHCLHRARHAFTMRPRKDDCVYLSNLVVDNDTSGTYTDDKKSYPSSREVAWEDRDEDEETNEDGERDYLMSGGLISNNTDFMGRFEDTIPFNQTDPLIRDKNPFEEESSSEDDSASKKSKKRRKKNLSSGEGTRRTKRPRITDDTDEHDIQPPHPLSRISRSIKKTASRITKIIDEPDTQPTHRRRERSHMLPHLSTTLGTLSESLQRRQSESGASKPTKKTTSKKKKTPTNTPSTQPTQTIIQMVQRVAKPLTTKLSYPINFNARSFCSICSCPSYAIIGTGSPRNVKIYDFGHGNREMPDANQAGKSQPMQPRPEETSLCLACTTAYMRVLMCNTHDVVPLDVESVFEPSAAFAKASGKQCTKDEVKGWCSLCPAPASYFCDKNCGAKFCDTCGSKVYAEDGDLNAMLDQIKDEITHEYKHGLRADVELLRKGGELERFLARMAAGAGRNRTG
ncbi:hypothetical protein KCU92_g5265, partial [Aureobasidium melanogenum]